MEASLKKFGRVLGISLGAFVVVSLLVVVVTVFFSGQRYSSPAPMGMRMMGDSAYQESFPLMNPTMMENDKSSSRSTKSAVPLGFPSEQSVTVSFTGGEETALAEKKAIKTGSLTLKVTDADEALRKVSDIAKEMGGSVSESNFGQVAGGQKSGTVTVRVSGDRFDDAFARLKGVAAVVVTEYVSESDVTAEYIDLQARINNKKAAEATLQTLFERAVKISDVIEVTDKLAMVRSEIESLEGQRRYLDGQTERATITLVLSEDTQIVADRSFRPGQTVKESVMGLFRILGSFARGIITLVILGIPMLLVNGLILWLVYRLAHRVVSRYWPGSVDEKRKIVRKR